MKRHTGSGQTLIALLIFIMLTTMITLSAVAVTIINIQSNNGYQSGETALMYAESGVENAMERFLRNPNYVGETMTLDNGTATITVSGAATRTIVSTGVSGPYRRTITATATYANTVLTISTWSETP